MAATPNRAYPKPDPASLAASLPALLAALDSIDADVAAILAALTEKAALASPDLTGTPRAPTPEAGDNSTLVATTAFVAAAILTFSPSNVDAGSISTGTLADARLPFAVSTFFKTLTALASSSAWRTAIDVYSKAQTDAAIAALVNSAPATLDTLQELAEALGNDPNFSATIMGMLGGKASNAVQAGAVWQAGASTTETIVSPAKVESQIKTRAYDGEIVANWTWSTNVPAVDFKDLADYQRLKMLVSGLAFAGGTATAMLRVSADNGATFLSAGYASRAANDATNTQFSSGFGLTDDIEAGIDAGAFDLDLFNLNGPTIQHGLARGTHQSTGAGPVGINNALRLTTVSGASITGGRITLLGWRGR